MSTSSENTSAGSAPAEDAPAGQAAARRPLLLEALVLIGFLLAVGTLSAAERSASSQAAEADTRAPQSPPSAVRSGALPPPAPLRLAAADSLFEAPLLARYHDPTAAGQVPLRRVAGRFGERLSAHLRVGDLAARDGAAYARISTDLVDRLELLITAAPGSIYVNSAYRHPSLNASPEVGGASHSQHLAGRAADLTSGTLRPLELAELALAAMGCEIGIGLGPRFVHVDVRGRLASWSRPGAALGEDAFDGWVRHQCFGTPWTADTTAADTTAAADSAQARAEAGTPAPEDAVAAYRSAMAALARVHYRQGVRGTVVLDLRGATAEPGASSRLSFMNADVLKRLIPAAAPPLADPRGASHFSYLVIAADGRHVNGIAEM